MKKLFKSLALLLPFILTYTTSLAQQSTIDLVNMYQLINESQSEHKLQVNTRNQQAVNSANEAANMTLLAKLKNTYRSLQQRYNLLGTAITVTNIALQAKPMTSQIIAYQNLIFQFAQKNPSIIALAYQTEIEFTEKAESLLGYLAGLTISIGDINQMKASDRKMLFDYVIYQLSRLQELSGDLLSLLQYNSLASVLKGIDPFQSFISQDKSIASSIIQNAKYLK